MLGALDQAKSALFYLVPYQGKGKFPIQEALPILNDALQYVDHNPSQHPTESGTKNRNIKYLLTRTLNRMHLRMEISDYEMAASLLELPSVISSDRFAVGDPKALSALRRHACVKQDGCSGPRAMDRICEMVTKEHAKRKLRNSKQAGIKTTKEVFLECDRDAQEEGRSTEGPDKRSEVEVPERGQSRDGKDLVPEYGFVHQVCIREEKKATSIFVPEAALYLQRGKELECLSYYEYLGCVHVKSGKAPATSRGGEGPSEVLSSPSLFLWLQ